MKKVCEMSGCENCPMRKLFPDNTFVAPRMGTGLRLAIAEAPGAQEAEEGEPLVGGAGSWLRGTKLSDGRRTGGMYAKAGVRDEEITFANVLNCRPLNNIFPTDSDGRSYISEADAYAAVSHCLRNHVEPLLRSRPWKRIDLFGDKPLKFIA